MQCDLTRTATIMYDDSVGQIELLYSSIDPMATTQHHQSAHHSGLPNWIRSQHAINKIHTGLLAHLLSEMKKVPGLLEDTLVLYGSDMSDGDQHLAHNLPILLAGAGADLKFGQEVGDPSARRRLADLFVEMGRDVYGIPGFNSFGEGANASMGSTIGITR
jgi:hypothetical protein